MRLGFVFISQKGSHKKYRKMGNPTLTVIVPANKKEIPFGTFRSILKQSRLQIADFEN
jgi:predicted RNA binding protein YcfA (HicA-like mRNA interferase family)